MNPARELKKIALELEQVSKQSAEFIKEGWYEFKRLEDPTHFRKWLDIVFGEDEAAELVDEFSLDEFKGKFGDTGRVLEAVPADADSGTVGPIPVYSQSRRGFVDKTVEGFLTADGKTAYISADEYERNLVD